jgi:hypothetical protein
MDYQSITIENSLPVMQLRSFASIILIIISSSSSSITSGSSSNNSSIAVR